MPENLPDPAVPTAPELVINPSQIRTVLVAAASMFLFASSFVTAILGFVGKRDLAGAIVFLQSNDNIAGLTSIAGGALFVTRMVINWRRKAKEVKMANELPAHKAMLTTELPKGPDAPAVLAQIVQTSADASSVQELDLGTFSSPTRAREAETGARPPIPPYPETRHVREDGQ